LSAAAVLCVLAEQADNAVLDRKNDMLKLYDSLPTHEDFYEVDDDEFYELYDKVS
jgi:hypothetical protein